MTTFTVPGTPGANAWKMPATLRDVWDIIYSKCAGPLADHDVDHAYIERVASMPGQGVASTFKFGKNAGMLEAFLIAANIPYTLVTPSKWCGFLGLRRQKDETNVAWKNRHKAMAQQLFPALDITHAVADALLIAHFGLEWGGRRGTVLGIDPGQSGGIAVVAGKGE